MAIEPETTDVRKAHKFDEAALARYLSSHLPDFRPPLRLRQFEGGQSNPTFLIETADRRWVLRRKPSGVLLPSAHQVGREYRAMKALEGSAVPVPAMRLHCEDPAVIGAEFFVMDWVGGRVFHDHLLPGLDPIERRALYDDLMDVLAKLHAVDPAAVGLDETFGRSGNYFDRQIRRWSQQYVASMTHDIPEMTLLMRWLPANIPRDDQTSIVHGDYSFRNCIVHPTEPRISAVLDWELSTIGNPLGDLAYASMFYLTEGREDAITELGIPSRAAFFARYFKAAGRAPVEDWTFYLAFVLFRNAAINQGVYKRGLDGNAASDRFRASLPRIGRNAQLAARLIAESG